MEAVPIIYRLWICFLFHFRGASLVSDYVLPDRYFINCGSVSTVPIIGVNFTGDENPVKSVTVPSGSGTRTAEDHRNSSGVYELHGSARIFEKRSSYAFQIDDDLGPYVVRFHFSPFPSLGRLSDFRFNVSASGVPLLSNFTVEHWNSSTSPPIEEFLLPILRPGKFRIDFVPYSEGFFAFVNAIEVFPAPPELIPVSYYNISRAPPQREGKELTYNDLRNYSLHVVHRINVGGESIMPDGDTLLRYWIPDDGFIVNKTAAENIDSSSGRIEYQREFTPSAAPDIVYRTAKKVRYFEGDGLSQDFNVSWRFGLRGGAEHLLRAHFCDIVTKANNEFVNFSLNINTNFSYEVWPFNYGSPMHAFYKDYVVESDDSGFMNISIGPYNISENKEAFLNGVEIMELIGNTSSLGPEGAGLTRKRMLIIVGLGVGGGILAILLVILAVCCLLSRKKEGKPSEISDWGSIPNRGGMHNRTTSVTTASTSLFADLNLGLTIPLAEIVHATNKFDPKLKIGEGGFGKVYKGTRYDGTKVAIKKSDEQHGQGLSEFQTEIIVLSKIRHHHLVPLIGYCNEGDEMILVYEYMERGTLRDHLYPSVGGSWESPKLSWEERLKICIGAAKGLHYLHTSSSGGIIHRDIKSTNILLDEHYIAKVADFGLSRIGHIDQSYVSTEVKGSFGYMDPECFKCMQLTPKSDVYSFGVVLLEVLCARPALNRSLPQDQINLAEWGLSQIKEDCLHKIIDPLLIGKINPDCLRKFGETVEKCLQDYGADRPNMTDVLWDLEYCLQRQHGNSCEDSTTTDVAMGLPMAVFTQLPLDTMSDDELPGESNVVSKV